MMNPLLIKLAMVGITMGIVGWIGWPLSAPQQAGGSFTQRQNLTKTASRNADQTNQPSVQPGQVPTHVTTAQARSIRTSVDRLLDLNRANAGDLQALPGIGAVLAQRVIAFRQSVGGFRSIDELRGVKGIGVKKFDRLKPLVTVSAVG